MRGRRRRALAGARGVVLGVVALTLCSCGGPLRVAEPDPTDAITRDACRALHDRLPSVLDGADRQDVDPVSDLTAAWGDPAIVLRCGVPPPAAYEPTSLLGTYDGVDWLPVEQTDGYVFYATGRVAWVEVTVPSAYAPEVDPLVDLAAAVAATVPLVAGD